MHRPAERVQPSPDDEYAGRVAGPCPGCGAERIDRVQVRRAIPDDAAELTRLRGLMFAS